MNKDSDILNQIGRRTGMTVPDGYFEAFAGRMAASLPDLPVDEPEQPQGRILGFLSPKLWQRVRPYVYMAAMFAGVWLMMWTFSDVVSRQQPDMGADPVLASVLGTEQMYDFYGPDVDEYELINELCDDGYNFDDSMALN